MFFETEMKKLKNNFKFCHEFVNVITCNQVKFCFHLTSIIFNLGCFYVYLIRNFKNLRVS